MKILQLLLVLVLGTLTASAQKLKTTITEAGDTLYSTKDEKIYTKAGAPRSVGDYIKSSVYKLGHNGKPILSLEIQTGRTSSFSIGSGSAADLTLKDGTVVTVYSRRDAQSKVSKVDYGCYIFPFYTLTEKDVRQLKTSPVSTIRIHASIGPMDYEIKEKFGDEISEQIEQVKN